MDAASSLLIGLGLLLCAALAVLILVLPALAHSERRHTGHAAEAFPGPSATCHLPFPDDGSDGSRPSRP